MHSGGDRQGRGDHVGRDRRGLAGDGPDQRPREKSACRNPLCATPTGRRWSPTHSSAEVPFRLRQRSSGAARAAVASSSARASARHPPCSLRSALREKLHHERDPHEERSDCGAALSGARNGARRNSDLRDGARVRPERRPERGMGEVPGADEAPRRGASGGAGRVRASIPSARRRDARWCDTSARRS